MRRLAMVLAVLTCAAAPLRAQTADVYIAQVKKPGTGDDSPARLQVRRLTNFGFRPGAEAERAAHEAALLNGLKAAADWEIKAFLIEELRFCGKTAAIAPLAAYLADANLCEPAAQSLLGIATTEGSDKIIPTVRAALPSSAGKCRTTLMRAAGSLRDGDVAVIEILIQAAAGSDRAAATVALRSLANIGDPKARAPLAASLKAADPFDAFAGASLGLLLAQRLAERGLKSEATAVAEGVKVFGSLGGFANVSVHADITLELIRNMPAAVALPGGRGGLLAARAMGGRLRVELPEGAFILKIADARGRLVAERHGNGAAPRSMEFAPGARGMYQVSWEGAAGRLSRAVVLY